MSTEAVILRAWTGNVIVLVRFKITPDFDRREFIQAVKRFLGYHEQRLNTTDPYQSGAQ